MAHVTIDRDPDQSMYVVSFDPETIDSTVIRTGFMQRSITIHKTMTLKDRMDNMFRDIDLQGTVIDKTAIDQLITSSKETEEFIKKTPKYTVDEGTKELEKSYVEDALNTLLRTSNFLQEEGASFVQLYVGRHFPVLSWHHAIWRGSAVIETEDVKYAYMEVLRPAFLDVISWIESKSEVKKAGQVEKSEENIIKELYNEIIKDNKCVVNNSYISKSDLTEAIRESMNVSEATAKRKIEDLFHRGKVERYREGKAVYIRVI